MRPVTLGGVYRNVRSTFRFNARMTPMRVYVICRHRHLSFFVVRIREGVPRSPCASVSARPHPQAAAQNPRVPLHLRKNNLAQLLARRPEGIFVSDFEQGEIGPDLFRHACKFGLEGMVSKRRDSIYRAGRSPKWIKVKNRSHPAMDRVQESFS